LGSSGQSDSPAEYRVDTLVRIKGHRSTMRHNEKLRMGCGGELWCRASLGHDQGRLESWFCDKLEALCS
jgi:hypothetical protein